METEKHVVALKSLDLAKEKYKFKQIKGIFS